MRSSDAQAQHTHAHTHTHTHTHSLTHSLTHSRSHTHTRTHLGQHTVFAGSSDAISHGQEALVDQRCQKPRLGTKESGAEEARVNRENGAGRHIPDTGIERPSTHMPHGIAHIGESLHQTTAPSRTRSPFSAPSDPPLAEIFPHAGWGANQTRAGARTHTLALRTGLDGPRWHGMYAWHAHRPRTWQACRQNAHAFTHAHTHARTLARTDGHTHALCTVSGDGRLNEGHVAHALVRRKDLCDGQVLLLVFSKRGMRVLAAATTTATLRGVGECARAHQRMPACTSLLGILSPLPLPSGHVTRP